MSGRPILHIPAFPLDVRDLKERNVVFEADPVKVSERQITFHCLAKIVNSQIQLAQYGWIHGTRQNECVVCGSTTCSNGDVRRARRHANVHRHTLFNIIESPASRLSAAAYRDVGIREQIEVLSMMNGVVKLCCGDSKQRRTAW